MAALGQLAAVGALIPSLGLLVQQTAAASGSDTRQATTLTAQPPTPPTAPGPAGTPQVPADLGAGPRKEEAVSQPDTSAAGGPAGGAADSRSSGERAR